jgi:predicted DNA-binding transcriptional regulator AlpA
MRYETSDTASPLDRLVDFSELVARFFPTSRATLYRMVEAGTFPAPVAVGRRRYWRARDIAAWIADQTPAPQGETP